jgi:hypothetical protein
MFVSFDETDCQFQGRVALCVWTGFPDISKQWARMRFPRESPAYYRLLALLTMDLLQLNSLVFS